MRGRKCVRDIVQFVPFRDCLRNGVLNGDMLAKFVLAEIPTQFREYALAQGIKPGASVSHDGVIV